MNKYLLVFRSAHKEKETIGLVAIIGSGSIYPYTSKYNYSPSGKYSVQTDSIFYNIQVFLKNPLYEEIL